MTETTSEPVLHLTAEIVAAHTSHNHVTPEVLLRLIESVYATLAALGTATPVPDKPHPAVPVKRSVFPEYIVCLEDGRKLQMLKGHLRARFNLTPEQYREKWGLPATYPMVAPNYAARRSTLAKKIGLEGKKAGPARDGAPVPQIQQVPEGVRGRRIPRKPRAA